MEEIRHLLETPARHDLLTRALKTELKALAAREPLCHLLNSPNVRNTLIEAAREIHRTEGLHFFFAEYISSRDSSVNGETSEDFLFRKKELSLELNDAFQYFVENDWQINLENYNILMKRGDSLCADSLYSDAFQCFSKATFLADVLEPSGKLLPELSETGNREFGSKILSYEARKKQVDCLFKENQFRKASIYANHLLSLISKSKVSNMEEFYAALKPHSFVNLMEQMVKSEVTLNCPFRGVELCRMPIEVLCGMEKGTDLSKALQEVRKVGFEAMIDFMDYEKDNAEDVEKSKSSARIVVNSRITQKFSNGQFIVPSLEVAIKIAKENDTIFLEPGTYKGITPKKNKTVLEVCKSLTIVGAGPHTIIVGSIIKWGSGKLRFQNLRFVVGGEAKDDEEIYLMDGTTEFVQCSIYSPVNTAVYIVGNKNQTFASFDLCILDGCDSCVRFFSLEGHSSNLKLTQSIIHSMYSLISVVSVEGSVNLSVCLQHCYAMEIQDCLKLIVTPSSIVMCTITFSEVELHLYDYEATSSLAAMTTGTLLARNCHIYGNHIDVVGFDLQKAIVELRKITIETMGENRRQFSIGQGVKMLDVQKAFLNYVKVSGLRVGFQVSNSLDTGRALKTSVCEIQSCSAEECSVGILVKRQDDICQHLNNTEFSLTISNCRLHKSYYGIMIENAKTYVHVQNTEFQLTPLPVIVHVSSLNLFKLENCTPELRELPEDSDFETAYSDHLDDLYVQFGLEENLPHRVEYDPDEYIVYTDFCPPD